MVATCLFTALFPLLSGEALAAHNGDVVYVRSTDGTRFSSPVNLSNDAAPTSIARVAAADGVVHATWDGGEQPREVSSRRSTTDGSGFEATRAISNTSAGDSSENEVAASGAAVVYVWEDDVVRSDGGLDPCCLGDEVNSRRSTDAGATLAPAASSRPTNLSNTPDGHSRDPVVAMGPGLAAVAHEDAIGTNDEIFVETSTDGGATWTTGRNISNDKGQSAEPGVATTGTAVHVVWENRDAVALGYARSADGGATWSEPTTLPGAATAAGSVGASGATVNIVGCTNSGGDLVHYRSTDGGGTWSSGANLGKGCGKPKMAVNGNDVYVVWEDRSVGGGDVMYRRSTDGGATWSMTQNLSSNKGSSAEPAVATDPSTGTVHIVWFDLSEPAPPPATTSDVAPGPGGPSGTFTDDDGNVHEAFIEAIVARGITGGCSPAGDLYCPGDGVTRAQMATFLVKAKKLPAAKKDHFVDDDGTVHEENINRVADAQLAVGDGHGSYGPNDVVTRDQMASFLVSAFGLESGGEDRFDDDTANPHEANINALAQAQVARGCGDRRYCPRGPVQRDQMATFLAQALKLKPQKPST